MTNTTPPATNEDARLIRLAAKAAEEAEALIALLPVVCEVQWDRAKATLGEADETGRRATGGHSDPTADAACDPARLYLRGVLTKGEPYLAQAVSNLTGMRRGLERALNRWEGPEPTETADRAV